MVNLKKCFVVVAFSWIVLGVSGCGTFTPIPAQGGGKRFSVEQALISSSARKVISDLPIADLVGKSIALEISVIQDEGGGSIGMGGRPFFSTILGAQLTRNVNTYDSNGAVTRSSNNDFGYKIAHGEPVYTKDITYNGSDARQFGNMLSSYLLRNNIRIVSGDNNLADSDYLIEVIVDVFGIRRSRTDWLIFNTEDLVATTSVEYVITPLKFENVKRKTGRLSYDSVYREKYFFWLGPANAEFKIVSSDFGDILTSFGEGVGSYENLRNHGAPEFEKSNSPTQLIINPVESKSKIQK